jgi:hypothetical protein
MISRHKYGAQRTEYNGIKYDSKLEAKIARDVELLAAAGILTRWARQVRYELRGLNGKVVATHVVDFVLEFADNHTEAWEAKGYPTEDWKLKRKLFEDNYPSIAYVIHSKNPKVK